MKKILILVLVLIFHVLNSFAQDLYMVSKANINFTSDAPLEVIEASSNQCTGVLKITEGSFAFRVTVKSFEGFNSSLQKTHFNENYMESSKFPYAVFEGKIIEEIDFYSPGTHSVRGKGSFTSHGVKQERIIKCKLTISPDKIIVKSDFSVLLDDHNIKIPSVVRQKIAEEILVHLELELVPKK
ncbi:MAG: YceI family protein [Bacteroidales bacterium]|nr:YceI family protein [Bacteroidales bacterium]